jgi:diguanylate cyclase (GGDEF)-like protein
MGMQTKITLLLIFLGVLPASILGFFALRYHRKELDANRQIYQGFSKHIASEIYRRMRGYRILLNTSTQLFPPGKQCPKETVDILRRIMAQAQSQEQGLEGLALYDRSKTLLGVVGTPPMIKDVKSLFSDAAFDTYGGSASSQPRNMDPIPVSAEVFQTSPAFTYLEETERVTQTQMKFLVYGPNDVIRGELIASLTPDYLSRSLNQILSELSDITQEVDIYVLDAVGNRIAATRDAKYGEAHHPDRHIVPEIEERSDEGMAQRTEAKLKTFYTPDWRIVLVPRDAALKPIAETRKNFQRVILLGIMIAILVGLMVTRTITNPLSRLVQSALAISQGDLSHPVEVQSHDEIGDLAATFELMRINLSRMQENLKERINELATLRDVGTAISSTLNFNELLHLILDLVMKLLKADRGSIMLLDDERQELTIAVAKGLSPEVVEKTRVKLGEKVAGYVLETGRPLLITDPHKSPSFQRIKDSQVHQGSLIAVPLVAKDKKLGVLNVSKSAPYTLDEKDLEFFKALSIQAAIAIENARLYELAIKDELTKLFVRRYFDQRLKEELRRAKRYRSAVTVMLLDIDHFKGFNDTYGHASGDEVLCFLSRVMRECVRNVDIVSRYGGEEFAILCPEQPLKDAIAPAERIRKTVETTTLTLQGQPVRCTVSIGLASFPLDAQRPDALVEFADQALYHAKNNGRNQVCAYRDLPRPASNQR